MLDPSVVLSKGGGVSQRVPLNRAMPEVVVDGGAAGASVTVYGAGVQSGLISNAFVVGSWAGVATTQPVTAGSRRAFRLNGPGHVPIIATFS
jgi:hypothetical protein